MMLTWRRFRAVLDIAAALFLALLGALAVASLEDGSAMRIALVAPILLFSPGYLLLQAVLVPARPAFTRVLHGVVSVGISLALVGLVSLFAAVVRGGFRPAVIVILVTLTCVALAAVATYRRLFERVPAKNQQASQQPRFQRFGAARPRSFFRPPQREQPRAADTKALPVVTAVAEPQRERTVTGAGITTNQEGR